MLAVVASMEEELAGLRANMDRPANASAIGDGPEFGVIGIGGPKCRKRVLEILSQHAEDREAKPIDGLLLLGFAGGIDLSLVTGDLVLAPRSHLAAATTGEYGVVDDAMYDLGLEAASKAGLAVLRDDSLTVDRLIATSAEKLELGRTHTAASVNMEDYWVAEAAAEMGVPFLAARVVLDPAGQDLPRYLPTFARSRWRAVLGTATAPWRLPKLLGIALQMRRCQLVLTRFAVSFVERWEHRGAGAAWTTQAGAVR